MLIAATQHRGISDTERGPRAFSYRPALLLRQPCSSQKSAASNQRGRLIVVNGLMYIVSRFCCVQAMPPCQHPQRVES